jgi:phosphatidylglycerol:prolipoprotein diacylglycerol transferase
VLGVYPTFFSHQGLSFHTWGLMITLAFSAAILVLHMRAWRVGIDSDKLIPFYMLIVVMGLLCSRLLHFVFAETSDFFANPLIFFDMGRGGFAFYGGVIGAGLSGAWYGRRVGIPLWKLVDLGAPCIMLGLGIGRIGCFMAGCCHGARCAIASYSPLLSLPGGDVVSQKGWPYIALVFAPGVGVSHPEFQGVPLYPTQLWESVEALSLFVVLSLMWRHWRRFDGQVMATLLLVYPLFRSFNESFRGDSVRGTDWFGLLSTSQLVSVPVLLLGLGIWIARCRSGVAEEIPFVFDEDEAI